MVDSSIPVDLFNPGQVFACLGFMEAAQVLLGEAEAGFDWRDSARATFRLRTPGSDDPFRCVLSFLERAQVSSLAPRGSGNATGAWAVPTTVLPAGAPFPCPDPDSPATLPAALRASIDPSGAEAVIVVDYWGEPSAKTGRDAVKFWGGAGGYPGAALARDALALVRDQCVEAAADPFALACPQSSSFRLDWRRDYIPLDAGFSLNEHTGRMVTVGFPLVEILGAVGLAHARPQRVDKLSYRYRTLGVLAGDDAPGLMSPPLLRAALGGADLPFPMRLFHMQLGWPAKEGQARCITHVYEETSP